MEPDGRETSWSQALDLFEARLDAFRAVLDDDVDPVTGPWPPGGTISVPIPPDLVARAEALLVRSTEIEQRLVASRDALQPALRSVRRRSVSRRPSVSAEL